MDALKTKGSILWESPAGRDNGLSIDMSVSVGTVNPEDNSNAPSDTEQANICPMNLLNDATLACRHLYSSHQPKSLLNSLKFLIVDYMIMGT